MRVSGGTILLIIIGLPLLVPALYYLASIIKAFALPDLGVPDTWFTAPYFIARAVFGYLHNLLTDVRVLAVLLGLGLIIDVISSR